MSAQMPWHAARDKVVFWSGAILACSMGAWILLTLISAARAISGSFGTTFVEALSSMFVPVDIEQDYAAQYVYVYRTLVFLGFKAVLLAIAVVAVVGARFGRHEKLSLLVEKVGTNRGRPIRRVVLSALILGIAALLAGFCVDTWRIWRLAKVGLFEICSSRVAVSILWGPKLKGEYGGCEFWMFQQVVWGAWRIALLGVFLAVLIVIARRRRRLVVGEAAQQDFSGTNDQ